MIIHYATCSLAICDTKTTCHVMTYGVNNYFNH